LEGIPLNQKAEIVRALTGSDVYKEDQQRRLTLDSTLKRYNTKLKEIDDDLGKIKLPNTRDKAEADELRKQRMALRSERDQLLDFKSLSGYGDEEDFGIEDEEDLEDDEEDEDEGPKIRFDPNNSKHKATAEKLFKKYRDKEKVRKILQRNFKL
jgi:hypothetical protein